MTPLSGQRLLVKVARLYFDQELTQSEISARLNLSRQKVQRLIRQAREEGLVQITIRPVIGAFPDLERILEERFGLREAVVVETTAFEDQQAVAREVGAGAADYLNRVISPGDSIVISWGGSLLGMVNALYGQPQRPSIQDVKVIQGLGGLGDPTKEVHAGDLTRRLAQRLGGLPVLLPAPAVAGSIETSKAYQSDPYVKGTLEQARAANYAFMGIGAPRQDSILMREGKIVSWAELQALQDRGAVGDINLRYFDRLGRLVPTGFDDRFIGLTLYEIEQIPTVVGIAGGKAKVSALRGALEGKLVNVLVTDHLTAKAILEM